MRLGPVEIGLILVIVLIVFGVGKLPGELTPELPEGDDYPVGNVNFAEAEAFWQEGLAGAVFAARTAMPTKSRNSRR